MPLIKFNPEPSNVGPRATKKQVEYIASLFIDCLFSPSQGRDYLNGRYGVQYADDLTIRQASLVIDDLKCRKDQTKLPLKDEDEE
jgi:hypothetical protein